MTDLTKEQEAALVEALENGGKFSDAGSSACITMGTFTAVQSEKLWLTRAGRLLAQALKERDEARANYQFMVERAADEKLDGYRELGARAAKAESERDEARAKLASCREQAIEGKLAMKSGRYGWRGVDREPYSRFCNIEKVAGDDE